MAVSEVHRSGITQDIIPAPPNRNHLQPVLNPDLVEDIEKFRKFNEFAGGMGELVTPSHAMAAAGAFFDVSESQMDQLFSFVQKTEVIELHSRRPIGKKYLLDQEGVLAFGALSRNLSLVVRDPHMRIPTQMLKELVDRTRIDLGSHPTASKLHEPVIRRQYREGQRNGKQAGPTPHIVGTRIEKDSESLEGVKVLVDDSASVVIEDEVIIDQDSFEAQLRERAVHELEYDNGLESVRASHLYALLPKFSEYTQRHWDEGADAFHMLEDAGFSLGPRNMDSVALFKKIAYIGFSERQDVDRRMSYEEFFGFLNDSQYNGGLMQKRFYQAIERCAYIAEVLELLNAQRNQSKTLEDIFVSIHPRNKPIYIPFEDDTDRPRRGRPPGSRKKSYSIPQFSSPWRI